MRNSNRRRYESQVRVRAFCADHREIFTGTPLGEKMLAQLDASVAEAAGHFASQSKGRNAAQEGAAARHTARTALRGSLTAIVRTSRFLGLAAGPTAEQFPMPRRGSDQLLVADATAILEKAVPLADAFVAHGLPANVLKELPAQIAAVNGAILAQAAGRETHVGANVAVNGALDVAAQAVDALESIFLNAPDVDANAVAMWQHARRIGPARVKEVAATALPATMAPGTPEPPTPQPPSATKAA